MKDTKNARYSLDKDGEFVIENYNFSKPFANFFPGIAGSYGIPMWVFYVNRGQAIVSLGTRDKDHSIMEFLPANKAWQRVSLQGFRTFLKVSSGAKKDVFYEPFHNGFINLEFDLRNRMRITPYDLKLEEENLSLGLGIEVDYFNIPQDSFAALARTVTVTNLSGGTKRLEMLDGLPQIIPYGTANLFLKKLSRTIEAWMRVRNLEKGVPFYKLDVDPTDRPEIVHIKEGNFYLNFVIERQKAKIIRPIVDPQTVFGPVTDFSCPYRFLRKKTFRHPQNEVTESKTPCALSLLGLELKKGECLTLYSLIGQMRSIEMLNASLKRIADAGYLARKKEENRTLIEELLRDIETKSGSREFDLYAKQTYLDNILRGGYPVNFKSGPHNSVFYLYSRKHGDLERDYNKFQIQPSYFSQGNGNYRDINQNRRCDTWFNPEIDDENLVYFFNLLQTDGYNPLVVKGISYALNDKDGFKATLAGMIEGSDNGALDSCLSKPFTPGEVIMCLEENGIRLRCSYDEFLNRLLSCSLKIQEAEHGEGFWSDHWAYNLDLLENYLGLYPEKLKALLFEKKAFTFFDNTEVVRPRAEKYVLYDGKPRQLHAVGPDNAKRELIRKRTLQPHVVRAQYGTGEVYRTTLIGKLLCVFANKFASLDPFGTGIEMEANKPNWYDALNGLPALFGSSLCETLELKRLILFIREAFLKTDVESILLTEEVLEFLLKLHALTKEYFSSSSADSDFRFWDASCTAKEDYRARTKLGVSGAESRLNKETLLEILELALKKLEGGIRKAKDPARDLYYSYFINEVSEYEPLREHFIRPLKFAQKPLPLFLEGQMHALRLAQGKEEARRICQATRESELFDSKLGMYKVTASLKSMPEEIGRCRVFTPGWLEHESIWLHMEYKYLLEMLKKGLYDAFYRDFKQALIPFQKPRDYGRSILENSSFLVSSAFPDKSLHGNGFVARLSGSTAEFLEMWLIMNCGKNPFFLDEKGALALRLNPALPRWLFSKKERSYSFRFLSRVLVVYHNPKLKDTFGPAGVKPARCEFRDAEGKSVIVHSGTLPPPYAEQVRSRRILRIDVHLA